MDISIIVPVFNVEKYINRCLDSIFNQQFSGTFEVIAVDDGSSDNSLQLLKKFQIKEDRLKIIAHEENRKLSVARATGMKAAIGDYIMHVDADDWLLPGALARLHSKITETDADIVVFNYVSENSKGERTFRRQIKKELISTDKSKVQSYFYATCWNKIVKRALTYTMICGEVSVNNTEDLLYSTEILFSAGKICLVPESYYVYFVNNESLTHIVKPEQYIQNQIIILKQLQKIVSKFNANPKLIRNILKYFEKCIYLEVAKTHFWYKGGNNNNSKLLREFSHYPIMTKSRIRRLKLSIKSSIICLFEVVYRLGFKMVLGIIRKSIKIKYSSKYQEALYANN